MPFGMSESAWNAQCDAMKCGTCGQYHLNPLSGIPFDCQGKLAEKMAFFEAARPRWEARLKEVDPGRYARYMERRR